MLKLQSWNSYSWIDERLAWNPAHYGNITETRFNYNQVSNETTSKHKKLIKKALHCRYGFLTLLSTTLLEGRNILSTPKELFTQMAKF